MFLSCNPSILLDAFPCLLTWFSVKGSYIRTLAFYVIDIQVKAGLLVLTKLDLYDIQLLPHYGIMVNNEKQTMVGQDMIAYMIWCVRH
ncbi:MAG: hypothetical protein ACREBI_06825 [Nitrosotalea sp.]